VIAKRIPKANLLGLFRKKKNFILFISLGFFATGLLFQIPTAAAWLGFIFAAFSVISNDSIQTLGTFIASNKNVKWWILWLFIATIFVCTVGYSWFAFAGDVSFQRLAARGLSEAPEAFSFLQVAAPLFLLILTRLKIPVSTTFLILSCFATSSSTIWAIVLKSISGYGLAFVVAFTLWLIVSKWVEKKYKDSPPHPSWRIAQWFTTGTLWSVWLMQDASNIAVFLPRMLSPVEFVVFAGVVVLGLGWILYRRGEKIQEVVEEKSRVQDIRSATLIDFVYAVILFVFKIQSNIPMSTTWVFIGLLAGREIAKSFQEVNEKRSLKDAVKMSLKDLGYITIGLVLSLVLAVLSNNVIRMAWLGF